MEIKRKEIRIWMEKGSQIVFFNEVELVEDLVVVKGVVADPKRPGELFEQDFRGIFKGDVVEIAGGVRIDGGLVERLRIRDYVREGIKKAVEELKQ